MLYVHRIGSHICGIHWCTQIWPWACQSRSNGGRKGYIFTKVAIFLLILVLDRSVVCTWYRKSYVRNTLVAFNMTLGLPVKVKRGSQRSQVFHVRDTENHTWGIHWCHQISPSGKVLDLDRHKVVCAWYTCRKFLLLAIMPRRMPKNAVFKKQVVAA